MKKNLILHLMLLSEFVYFFVVFFIMLIYKQINEKVKCFIVLFLYKNKVLKLISIKSKLTILDPPKYL